MKKALLLSSLLLAAAGCAAEHDDLGAVREEALVARASMVDKVFVSTKTFKHTEYDYVAGANGEWESIAREVDVKLRLTFIVAENYTLDEKSYDQGLDYEVVVEKVDATTGEKYYDDSYTFFVRRVPGGYHFYNCSSSRRCWSEHDISKMSFSGPEGAETLLVENKQAMIRSDDAELEFRQTAK